MVILFRHASRSFNFEGEKRKKKEKKEEATFNVALRPQKP